MRYDRYVISKHGEVTGAASLRWQIARRQLDGIPRSLATRPEREYWAARLSDASVQLAVVGARRSWLGKDAA